MNLGFISERQCDLPGSSTARIPGPCLSDSFLRKPREAVKSHQGHRGLYGGLDCMLWLCHLHPLFQRQCWSWHWPQWPWSSLPGVKMNLATEMERWIVRSTRPPNSERPLDQQPYERTCIPLLGSPCCKSIPNTLKISWSPQGTALTPWRSRGVA